MKISVLASGSSGNSTYIESNESKILIDAGISMKRINKYLNELGTDVHELDGIFITHEHVDHVKGLEKINKYHETPIFFNKETYNATKLNIHNKNIFDRLEFNFNDLNIRAIKTMHDAADSSGFIIKHKNKQLGYFTDLGVYNEEIKNIVSNSDSVVLESNHDVDMVLNGRYPYHLKQRILGELGHLSNIDAGLLIKKCQPEKLKNVFLAHISSNNNTDELVSNTFDKLTENMNINRIITKQNLRTKFIEF